jgi:hypothetical protein
MTAPDYGCGHGPAVPTEMQLFFRHREASLALADMMNLLAASDVKTVLVQMLDAVAVRRSPDKSAHGIGELTGYITGHLARWIPNSDGSFGLPPATAGQHWRAIELWYADASPAVIMYVLGQAAVRAANISADHAQAYADSLERQA